MQPGNSRSKSSIGLLLVSLVILAFSFLTPSTILPRLRLFTSHFTPTTTAIRPLTTTTATGERLANRSLESSVTTSTSTTTTTTAATRGGSRA